MKVCITSFLSLCLVAFSFLSCSDECSLDDVPANCKFDPDVAMIMCRAAIESYYFDQKSNSCVFYSYGGCNDTPYEPFQTLEECEACLCIKK